HRPIDRREEEYRWFVRPQQQDLTDRVANGRDFERKRDRFSVGPGQTSDIPLLYDRWDGGRLEPKRGSDSRRRAAINSCDDDDQNKRWIGLHRPDHRSDERETVSLRRQFCERP